MSLTTSNEETLQVRMIGKNTTSPPRNSVAIGKHDFDIQICNWCVPTEMLDFICNTREHSRKLNYRGSIHSTTLTWLTLIKMLWS